MDIREVIDAYTDDVCLYHEKDCEFRSESKFEMDNQYCVSGEDSYKCLLKRLGELRVKQKLPDNYEPVEPLI